MCAICEALEQRLREESAETKKRIKEETHWAAQRFLEE